VPLELATLVVNISANKSKLTGVLDAVKREVIAAGGTLQSLSQQSIMPKGGQAALGLFGKLQQAAGQLFQHLTGISGLALSDIFKLGSLGGMVGVIANGVRGFMSMSDEIANTEQRFKSLGFEAKGATDEFFAFGKELANTYGISTQTARSLAMLNLQRGGDPGRYQEMTRAAIGLGQALGVSAQQAARMVEMAEAGNSRMLLRFGPFKALSQGGKTPSSAVMEAKLNEVIAQGLQQAEAKTHTFAGQVQALKNNVAALGGAFNKIVGPALVPLFETLNSAAQRLTSTLTNWLNTNREGAIHAVQMAGSVLAAAGAMKLLRGGLGPILGMVGRLIPGFGLLSKMLSGLGGGAAGGAGGGLKSLIGGAKMAKTAIGGIGAAFKFLSSGGSVLGVVSSGLKTLMTGGKLASVAMTGLKWSLRGLVSASGIGLVFSLGSILLDLVGSGGQATGMFGGLGATIKDAASGAWKALSPIVNWFKVEIPVVLHAATQGFGQLFVGIGQLAKGVWSIVGPIISSFFSLGTGVAKIIAHLMGFKDLSAMWTEFVAEISVLGLRVKQFALMAAIGFVGIGQGILWVGQVAVNLVSWVSSTFVNIMVNAAGTVGKAFGLLGTIFGDIGKAFANFLKNPAGGFKLDFTDTLTAISDLKDQAVKTMTIHGPEIPEFNVAPELQKDFRGTQEQIENLKEKSRKDQAAAREKAGLPPVAGAGGKGTGGPVHIKVNSKSTQHAMQSLDGYFKMLQEAAFKEQKEDDPALKEQKESNKLLGQIVERLPEPGSRSDSGRGVVPR
jgi:hypothetical protein